MPALLNFSDASPVVLVIMLIIAVFLWIEGYRLYKLAVFFLGFIAGFSLSGLILNSVTGLPVPALVIQVVVGLALGAASFLILKLGLFIAAACAVFFLLNNLLQSLGIVGTVISFAAAVVAGFVATKADKPVIIVLTSIIGGFAITGALLRLIMLIPYDLSFLPGEGSIVWLIVKVLVSAVGIAIQFSKVKDED